MKIKFARREPPFQTQFKSAKDSTHADKWTDWRTDIRDLQTDFCKISQGTL